MKIIDADKFLAYLIFSKHIDSLTCGEVKEAIEMSKVDIFDKIREDINGMYRVILKDIPKDDWSVKWNTCLDEVLKIIDKYESENKDAEWQKCDTCYHNETEFSICQYCTGGDKYEERFKTDEWQERLQRALFTREEWEKVLKAMDEIYDIERKAREKEFIMPKETMYVDPIPDESIHTIDFAHGYDYCKNVMKKDTIQVLNNIRAKIEKYKATINKAISEDELKIEGMKEAYTDCLEIIDRYKKESE